MSSVLVHEIMCLPSIKKKDGLVVAYGSGKNVKELSDKEVEGSNPTSNIILTLVVSKYKQQHFHTWLPQEVVIFETCQIDLVELWFVTE